MNNTKSLDIMTVAEATATIAQNNPVLYSDLAQPSVQNLGKALCTVTNILNTVLTPIEIINETIKIKKEQFISSYEKKLSEIPPEKVCEANQAIIGHITENAKHKITDSELREKYAKLLAASSNSDNLTKPLLSFDAVLDQLSPYESELLRHLFPSVLPSNIGNNLPIADIICYHDLGYTYPYRNLTGIQFKNLSPDDIALMLSNFERLGIILINKQHYTEPVKEKYKFIFESQLLSTLQKNAELERKRTGNDWPRYDIVKGHFTLTSFGASFVKTVIL